MSPHTYPFEPLTSGDVFRYLVLEPGIGDEPLKCSLKTRAIEDTHYETISYVWGSSERSHSIECESHIMAITSSLFTVLKRIRSSDQPLDLWADGICINQNDLKEKGHQVGLMAKIYRGSQSVLIYVGSEDDGQGLAVCSLLDEVDKLIEETSKIVDMSWDSFPYPDEDHPLLADPRWDALHSLLGQNWFDRGWVVQEAACAPKGQVIWGESRFDWDKLMRVHIWMSTRALGTYHSFLFSEVLVNAHKNIYLDTHEDFGRAFHDEAAWGSPSILQTLNNAKELDLSNPQDRIYAFLELPQHLEQRVHVKPNYYSTHLETYQQFAIQYIQSTRNTELLDYVSHDDASPFSLPSWIPRWDISTWSLGQSSVASSLTHSRTGSTSEPVIMEDGSLKVHGVVIDTLHYTSDAFDWHTTTAETIQNIWTRIQASSVPCPYEEPNGTETALLDAFFGALSAGTYDGEFSEWRRAQEAFAIQAQLKLPPQLTIKTETSHTTGFETSEDTVSGAEPPSNIFFDLIRNRTHNRRFILTERGYMGLAPALVRDGDAVGIIFGCKTPCVLRKATEEQYYTYLGATALVGKEWCEVGDGDGEVIFCNVLGEEDSKDWVEWDVEEQDFYLC